MASASGFSGTNVPSNAIDGVSTTFWQSSTTTGWLAVQFRTFAYVNVVHAHFTTTKYASLSLYLDTSGNSAYETGEKVWSTTTNNGLDVIISLATSYALGMKITIDAKSGSSQPKINEFEAYLQGDSDGDGLTNAQEVASTYYQDMQPGALPQAIPDDAVNTSSSSVSLAQFYGVRFGALANFTVDHSRRSDLTAKAGYWNGSAWIDRYVWDPGKRLLAVGLTRPDALTYYAGTVNSVATVAYPEVTSKVEFRVGGVLQATVTTPVGNEYRWDWVTSGDSTPLVNVTQYDVANGRAWDQHTVRVNNIGPMMTWKVPADGATITGTVTVKVTVTDVFGVDHIVFYVDNVLQQTVLSPISGTQDYTWAWGSDGWMNGAHAVKAVAYDRGAPQRTTTSIVNVTTSNDPAVHITSPGSGAQMAGFRTVTADAASVASSISKVAFYLDGILRSTDTAAPYSWDWDTTLDSDGAHTLMAKGYRLSDGKTASSSIPVRVLNDRPPPGGDRCPPICPVGPVGADSPSSPPAATMGVLGTEWSLGESDVGTKSTVVVHLTGAQSAASPAENASRILRPAFPLTYFTTYLQWRLVVKDWSKGFAGNVTAFTLRFEIQSDPQLPQGTDTDGDSIRDGTEVNVWHTLPVTRDSDLDGLTDDYEIAPHTVTASIGGSASILASFTTDPTKSDSDGDGLSDGQERGFVTTGQSKVIGEVGIVKNLGATWTTVFLRNRYTAAVVIAEPTTFRDSAFSHIRITAVTDHTFQMKIEKWVVGGSGAGEDITYLVVESGNHVLPDGSVVEAGKAPSIGTSGLNVNFREPFNFVPVLLVQTQTTGDANPVIAKRTDLYSTTFFGVYLNANASASHGTETVGYIGITRQATPNTLATWTRTELDVPGKTGIWTYPTNFSSAPLVLAWLRGEASGGNKNIGLRLSSVTNHSATVYREQAATAPADVIGFFAFAGAMNLTARMTTNPAVADTDGDTLTDGTEVNTHGSNPSLTDSDADGMADNVEVTSRTITIPVNGTAKTITFKTSPTSDDTDADGIKDPDELTGILDHRVLSSDMQTVKTTGIMRDLSGNAGDGSILGATCSSSVAGKLGYACNFGGTTARLQFADSALVDLTSSFSISAWVYPTTTSQAAGAGIVAKGTGGGGESYAVDVASGSFRALLWKSGVSYVAQGTTTFAANTWYFVAAVYDGPSGVLRLYINAGTPVERTGVPSTLALNDHVLTVGSREGSATSGYNLGFVGRIDELSIWDRPLSASEIKGYYNLTNSPASIVSWLDMETRSNSVDLFDFSATSHTGLVTGTTVLEGRSGFARSFRGGTDGILLGGTTSGVFTGGVSASLYVLISSYPAIDAPVFARKGDFYLNLTSDGRIQWSIVTKTTLVSPLSLPLNRWVRIIVTAGSTGSSILLDGVQVASTGTASAPPTASTAVTLGYAEGVLARFIGSMDEVLVLNAVPASANTLPNLAVRGILLNPNGTDTDFDGLTDGQELFVKSVKTPKRYPIPDYYSGTPGVASTASFADQLSAPASFLASATAMVGVTHTFMGDLILELHHVVGGSDGSYVLRNRIGGGTDNNFTSYDMLNGPLNFGRQDFVASDPWYLGASDNAGSDTGVIEYLQIQLTVHTLPNRADTDVDGLNDSEEMNLGSDGFATDPWKADTDGDMWSDGYETLTKGTNPLAWDTDGDGVRDSSDLDPLRNLVVAVYVRQLHHGDAWWDPTLTAVVRVNEGSQWVHTWVTEYRTGSADGTDDHTASFWMTYYADVPDDVSVASVRMTGWSYNCCRNDDIIVDAAVSYTVNSGTGSWTVTTGNSWLSFDVWTVALPKAKTLFVTDGNATITLANGQNRLVGQDRYYVFAFDVTSAYGPFVVGVNSIVVPRSIFLDSKLRKDFDGGTFAPLTDATLYGEDLGRSSVSESVAGTIAKSLTGAEAYDVLIRLLRNSTNVLMYSYVDITSYVVLANLPYDVVRILPWSSPVTVTSIPFGPTGEMPKGFWEKIAGQAAAVINAFVRIGQLIYQGLVAFGTFLVNLAEAIVDWGMKALGSVAGAIAAVAQKAGEVLSQFATWIVNMAIGTITSAISGLLNGVKALLDITVGRFVRELEEAVATIDPVELANKLTSLLELVAIIVLAGAMIPIAIRVASIAIKAMTAGVSWLVETAISEGVAEFIVRVLMGIAFSLAAAALFTAILETIGWVEDTTVAFFKGIGLAATAIYAVSKVVFRLYESLYVKTAKDIAVLQRYKGFALSIFGLLLILIGSSSYAKKGLGRLASDLIGFAFQTYGFWLYVKNSKDTIVQIADFAAPIGSAVEHGVTILSPPVGASKIAITGSTGGYG